MDILPYHIFAALVANLRFDASQILILAEKCQLLGTFLDTWFDVVAKCCMI